MKHSAHLSAVMACVMLTGGAFAAPQTITLDPAYLERAAAQASSAAAPQQAALNALVARADALLERAPETVTAKAVIPPSGDKHDYMSIGPYWWPNPDTADGLPYIRKDGETNPSSKNDDTDSARIQRMCNAVLDLSLAAYFTGDTRYAEKAADYIRTWFIDDATRMNPNLRFGQSVPGIVDGRGIGLIDTRNFWMVIDGALILHDQGALAEDEMEPLKAWFGEFLNWMMTSPQGHEEYVWHNNHGTYFDAQVVDYALFTGNTDLAAAQLKDAIHLRMASHFDKNGLQHAELERTRPFHYSIFNLLAHLRLAYYGQSADVDYANATQDGRTLRAGAEFILGQALDPRPDVFTAQENTLDDEALEAALASARLWGKDMLDDALYQALLAENPEAIQLLLWPRHD